MRGYDRNIFYEESISCEGDRQIPSISCAYFDNNRYDSYLPTVWLAFGLAEPRFDFSTDPTGLEPAGDGYGGGTGDPRLNQDEGMFFACSSVIPHPVVMALASETVSRPYLIYKGTRVGWWLADSYWDPIEDEFSMIYYYNTPYISMSSLQIFGWSFQTRYNLTCLML